MGIPEPPFLDPYCGAAALATGLRAFGLPYDRDHVAAKCHITGEGDDLQDLMNAGRQLGVHLHSIRTNDQGLKDLPKPLIAHVEQDHFVAVTQADKSGVTYLCSDCGAWPGGEVHLTWSQWHAMDADAYGVIVMPSSDWDKALDEIASNSHPTIKVASATSAIGTLLPHAIALANMIRSSVIATSSSGFQVTCDRVSTSPQCPTDGTVNCAMDQPSAGCSGPSSGDPVNLSTGEEENNPGPDITVYNPMGPSVVWKRAYYSLSTVNNYEDYGFGWVNNYAYQMSVNSSKSTGNISLIYPNGYTVSITGTAPTASQNTSCTVPAGSPFVVAWQYLSATQNQLVVTFRDHTALLFDPAPIGGTAVANTTFYCLQFLQDRNGHSLGFHYGAASSSYARYSLNVITNDSNTQLLTIQRNSTTNAITSVTTVADDTSGSSTSSRSVYYSDVATTNYAYELQNVSQVVDTGASNAGVRYQYAYSPLFGTSPNYNSGNSGSGVDHYLLLHSISVPSPTGSSSMDTATIQYDQSEYVGQLTDANGNTRTYTNSPQSGGTISDSINSNYTFINVSTLTPGSGDPGTTPYQFVSGYDTHMSSNYSFDDNGISSIVSSWDSNDPYRPAATYSGDDVDTASIYNTVPLYAYGFDGNSGAQPGRWEIWQNGTMIAYGSKGQASTNSSGVAGFKVSLLNPATATANIMLTIPENYEDTTHLEVRVNFTSSPAFYGVAYFDAYSGTKNPVQTTWDQYGNLTSATDPRSAVTTLTWDHSHFGPGDLSSIKDAAQYTSGKTPWTLSYLDNSTNLYRNGLITQITCPIPGNSGKTGTGSTQTSYFAYDESSYAGNDNNLGLLTSEAVVGNSNYPQIFSHWNYTTDSSYTATGATGSYSKAAAIGEPLVYTNNDGKQTHYRYDLRGNCTIVIDAVGNETDYVYNTANQITTLLQYSPRPSHSYVTGTFLTYLYVGGPLISEQLRDSTGTKIREVDFTYGHEGELMSESAVNFSVMTGGAYQKTLLASYTYDGMYHVLSSTDGNGNTTHYTYSSQSTFLTGIQYPGAKTQNGVPNTSGPDTVQMTAYDAEGNLLSLTDGNGNVINYFYDNPNSQVSQLQYVSPSNLNPYAVNVPAPRFTYDGYSRLQTLSDNGIGSEVFTYDDLDELLQKQVSYGPSALNNLDIAYTYNPDGSRATMSVPVPGLNSNTGYFSYNYDDLGRMIGMINPFNDETDWTYQANDWLASQSDYDGAVSSTHTLIDKESYTYDPRGLVTAMLNQGPTSYSNPLAQYGFSSSPMVYDVAGNRTSMPVSEPTYSPYSGTTNYSYDYKDELTQESTTRNSGQPSSTYPYDTAGNLGSTSEYNVDDQFSDFNYYTYDGDGNPTSYYKNPATYDINDHLSAYTVSGQAQVTTATTSDGLRMSRTQGSNSTYYVYDGGAPVVELSSSGSLVAFNSFGVNGLISRESGVGTSAKHFYAFDPQGTPSAILDGAGNTLAATDTAAYGNLIYAGNTSGDPYAGFGGQWGYYSDSGMGFELLGERYYDPNTGRFINRDPAGSAGGTNLYEYADDNPTGESDPSGLAPGEDSDNDPNDPANYSPPSSWGGSWLQDGQNGGTLLVNSAPFQAGSKQRSDISNDVTTIPGVGTIYGAIVAATGCDYIAGTVASPAQRVFGALGAISELGDMIKPLGRCAGGSCFVAGTPVEMADGTTRPIEQVKPGDVVESRDPDTGQTEAEEVIASESHLSGQTMTLTLSDGEKIECTPQHRFFVEGQGFVEAGKLTQGETLEYGEEDETSHRPLTLTVSGLNLHPEATSESTATRVYNFTVANTHTYFVGTTHQGVWVHNIAPSCIHYHHVFPKQFSGWFASKGIDVDKYTNALDSGFHLGYVHAGSRGGGWWNNEWADWIAKNPGANMSQIWDKMQSMRDLLGFGDEPMVPYPKK